ncbi:MAG: hypothetical protein LAT84_14535, partial [Balneolia bacterium]|nr:hypothetical protein [Balneolia bacterium]
SDRANSLCPNPTANFVGFEGRQRPIYYIAPLASELLIFFRGAISALPALFADLVSVEERCALY